MDDLLQEFVAETRETMEALTGEIVAWERDPADRDRLDAIFRFVHTVKGSCGFLDLPRLARLSHAAEDVLASVRRGERAADAALVTAVLAIVDRIVELVEAIDAGVALDDAVEGELIAALTRTDAPAPVSAAAPAVRTTARSVRLTVELLDRMMAGVSDMVLARNELARLIRDSGSPALENAFTRLSATVGELRETVTRTRMQRVEALFAPLQRLVRDTAAALGKDVALTIDGGDVELDREMIELMRDPLVHMVRNALDHGIETPADRIRAGKPAAGRLRVSARQSGNRILLEIADDGRGIDVARVVAKAIAADPARGPALRGLDAVDQALLIFEPGLSSRDTVTELSGRGVGMDVVRANVEQIGGRIALENEIGRGLAVTIEVPLTLSILSAVVVRQAGLSFAIPRQNIDEIVARRSRAMRIDRVAGAAIVTLRGERLPLVGLADVLGSGQDEGAFMLILDVPGGRYALLVDEVVDTEELVVKPASPVVMAAGLYAGQTLPDNGRPMLLLDSGGIARHAGLRLDRRETAAAVVTDAAPAPGVSMLLFRDLDGCQRVIALSAVDRIETARAHRLALRAGRWRLATEDGLAPLVAIGDLAAAGDIGVLWLHDDAGAAVGYAIAEPLDIVELTDPVAAARTPGLVAGVVGIAGEQVEVIDPLAIFADAGGGSSARPVCVLDGRDGDWLEAFLRPTIEAAGYAVARTAPPGGAAVTLAMEDDAAQGAPGVVRLSRRPGHGVYRFDRAAVVEALARATAR